jgi:hypothetical protein
MPPWFLHHLDVLGFCDRETKTIWSSKGTDGFKIMDKGMLFQEIEVHVDTTFPEDLTVVVKLLKGIV